MMNKQEISTKIEIQKAKANAPFEVGQYAMCWYFKIPNYYSQGLDLFYCKIIELGSEYATCQLFFGDEFNINNRSKGTFKDVCVADLIHF